MSKIPLLIEKTSNKQTVLHRELVFYFINGQEFSGKEKIMT